MKNTYKLVLALIQALALPLGAAVPQMLDYQGYVTAGGNPFDGSGKFKFALVDSAGTNTFWSHDGSSAAGAEPATSLSLPVENGVYSVLLGDTTIPRMSRKIGANVFADQTDVFVRVWFKDGTNGFAQLTPDTRIASVGYAMVAATVVDGAVKSDALAPNITLGGSSTAGTLTLQTGSDQKRAVLDAGSESGNASLKLYDATGTFDTVRLVGAESGGSGAQLLLRNGVGHTTIELDAQDGTNTTAGGFLRLKRDDGRVVAALDADIGSSNSGLLLYDPNGAESIRLTGAFQGTGAGFLQFRNLAGVVTMSLNGDSNGEGRLTTQVIEITGGSDLSERFDIVAPDATPEPGMIVCIHPTRPGELRLSNQAYDATVAGVISGAGGVKPGMLMGQSGTRAAGKYPVALSGRVYCQVDATSGPVRPGDLITTSTTPGYGMKASADRAAGAVVGKAMTGLETGRGLVLVLVSLQ